jgi:uncharacterized membrane protein
MDNQKQKNTIQFLYFMLIVSTILSFVPIMSAQVGSLALLFTVLIAAYFYRGKDSEDGLLFNHMTYLIGTIWIGTGALVIGIIAAGLWLYAHGDHAALHAIVSNLQNGVMMSESDLMRIFRDYFMENKNLIVLSSLVTIGPAMLYFVYRIANGLSRAMRGYRIANPKSWL